MLVRYSYSRSALLVSRYVLAVTKAPWYSVSVLYHAGTVLVYVAGVGYLVITGYRRALRQSQSTRLPITYVPLYQAHMCLLCASLTLTCYQRQEPARHLITCTGT